MGKICAVSDCPSGHNADRTRRKRAGHRQVSLFSVPKSADMIEKWSRAVGTNLTSKDVICELHFSRESIMTEYRTEMPNGSVHRMPRDRHDLVNDAVPIGNENQTNVDLTPVAPLSQRSINVSKIPKDAGDHANDEEISKIARTSGAVRELATQKNRFTIDDVMRYFQETPSRECWCWIRNLQNDKSIVLTQLDTNTFKIRLSLEIRKDLSVTISTSDNKVTLEVNVFVTSVQKIEQILDTVQRKIAVCSGTGEEDERENVKQLYECFCEVAAPTGEKQPWILQKYPETFGDTEILKSVPKFAYPCEIENILVQHFSFVLTSIDSKWTFGFCRHDPKTETALVILSPLPWHEIFYKLLNHVATLTSSNNAGDLWKFLGDVYTCGVPMPGASITIPLPDPNTTFVCQSPRQFQLPSIPENRNLTEYYSAVDSQNMMIVFASMLYERRIIFTSKRLSRLSACVQACNALIYPMIWQHIYIPVLPLALMDYLLAPMPFLIGVPAPIFLRVRKSDLGEVVVLDADSNTIETPFQDLESLPTDVVTSLKRALRNRPALLGDGVSRAFLRALVQLTAGYREALTLQQGERITFDQNAFVENRPISMQPFLRKMLELQIFQQFIEERLHMLNSGLGFSDEFEMEACNYSDKTGGKFVQQYREWTYAMRKEGSAFFRSVKDKANPAVKYAVKSVKDKGKDMKTAYKGLKWKGRSRGSENSMRYQQPRSAPSSPTLDRRHGMFGSPSKSPSGFTATTSYRKELRIRNINVSDTSRKQYSPLSPNSPEETDSPPERLNIDLMHELQDVIYPNNPPVDRTLKPVRSLDSLRTAWSGRLRHGPLPCTVTTANEREVFHKSASLISYQSSNIHRNDSTSTIENIPSQSCVSSFENFTNNKESSSDAKFHNISESYNTNNPFIGNILDSMRDQEIMEKDNNTLEYKAILSCNSVNQNVTFHGDNFTNDLTNFRDNEQITSSLKDSIVHTMDPFDTSGINFNIETTRTRQLPEFPMQTCDIFPFAQLNTQLSSTQDKKSEPIQQDLIRLDSTNSDDDFDPLLWSNSTTNYDNSKQMTQSLHIPQMAEGLSNPLYPYFLPKNSTNNSAEQQRYGHGTNEKLRDFDLLQEYGLDFNKFCLANGGASSSRQQDTADDRGGKKNGDSADDAFGSASFTSSSIKSQKNWTKFE